MWFTPAFDSLKSRFPHHPAQPGGRGGARRRPVAGRFRLEALEERSLLSAYLQTNLVSDVPGAALIRDAELVNAWGIVPNPSPTGAFWISCEGTGLSTLYTGDVTQPGGSRSPFVKGSLTVTIPGRAPTGQVFSGSTTDFIVSEGIYSAPSRFITVSNTGHVTGWAAGVPLPAPSRHAHLTGTTAGAVYTGLAIGNNGAGNFLYAADFRNGEIDVFNRTWAPTTLAGTFVDPTIPDDYAPFNIQNLGGRLYVTYALQDNADPLPRGGHGFVSVFDTNGNFLNRLVTQDHLKAPWGLALAPANFGTLSNTLLVGNFVDGRINAYDPTTGTYIDRLRDTNDEPIRIDGLLGLHFGTGLNAGDRHALYFTAGPDDGAHGLLGSLRVVTAGAGASGNSSHVTLLNGVDPSLLRSVVSPGVLPTLGDTHDAIIPATGPGGNSPVSARSADPSPGRLPAGHSSLLGEVDVATATAGDGARPAALDRLFALDSLFGDDVFGNGGMRR